MFIKSQHWFPFPGKRRLFLSETIAKPYRNKRSFPRKCWSLGLAALAVWRWREREKELRVCLSVCVRLGVLGASRYDVCIGGGKGVI